MTFHDRIKQSRFWRILILTSFPRLSFETFRKSRLKCLYLLPQTFLPSPSSTTVLLPTTARGACLTANWNHEIYFKGWLCLIWILELLFNLVPTFWEVVEQDLLARQLVADLERERIHEKEEVEVLGCRSGERENTWGRFQICSCISTEGEGNHEGEVWREKNMTEVQV